MRYISMIILFDTSTVTCLRRVKLFVIVNSYVACSFFYGRFLYNKSSLPCFFCGMLLCDLSTKSTVFSNNLC